MKRSLVKEKAQSPPPAIDSFSNTHDEEDGLWVLFMPKLQAPEQNPNPVSVEASPSQSHGPNGRVIFAKTVWHSVSTLTEKVHVHRMLARQQQAEETAGAEEFTVGVGRLNGVRLSRDSPPCLSLPHHNHRLRSATTTTELGTGWQNGNALKELD